MGHFDIENGSIDFAEQKIDFNAKGDNLRAVLDYNRVRRATKGSSR